MLNNLKHYYLQQMGIESWVVRKKNIVEHDSKILNINTDLSNTQTVFTDKNTKKLLIIMGNALSTDEAMTGALVTNKEGTLLKKMLGSIGLLESDICIINTLKHASDDSSDPEKMIQYIQKVKEKITLVSTQCILVMDERVGQYLLKTKTPLIAMRGQIHHLENTPLLITYPMAHLLLHLSDKKKAYNDMLLLKQCLSHS